MMGVLVVSELVGATNVGQAFLLAAIPDELENKILFYYRL